jgi:copper resistance protein C
VSPRREVRVRRPRVAASALLAGSAVLAGLSIALAAPASAHDELVSSSPPEGATVSAPGALTLTYSEDLVDSGFRVVVRGPDGTVDGDVRLAGSRLLDRFARPLAPGPYDVVWRVVSADGHPISGRLAFRVRRPAPSRTPSTSASATSVASPSATSASSSAVASPSSTTPAASTSQATQPQSSGGSSGGTGGGRLLTVGLVAAVVAAGAGALAAARRARGGPGA